MSAPPPGYNGDSILQTHGGTAEIVPVMGGGRVKKALYNIRKKHSRKPPTKQKQRNKRTRKHKQQQQHGGTNHYTLNEIDEYKINKPFSTRSAIIKKVVVPQDKFILPEVERDLPKYLKNQAKLWVRKLNTSVLLRSEMKPKVPTTDNIGCTFGLKTVERIVRHAPDRLCCILSRDTECITLLPAVNGDVTKFLRIAKYINAEPSTKKNRVYIFSPPFLGVNLENNKQIFDYFLYYKNTVSNSTNLWSFYILAEYSTQNIEAAKALSLAIRPISTITAELTKYIEEERKKDDSHPDKTIITSIYSMLEPTYIVYPHTVSFPVTSAETVTASIGKISREEYDRQIAGVTGKRDAAIAKVKEATQLRITRETEYTETAKKAWEANTSLTTAGTALKTPMAEIAALDDKIKADAISLSAMGPGVSATPEYSKANSALEAKKAELLEKKAKITAIQTSYTAAESRYNEANKEVERLKKLVTEAKKAESSATGVKTKAEQEFATITEQLKEFVDPEAVSNKAIAEEKGGLLFSAATKGEAILPAPYSGFDSAIKYIQTNDSQTKRGSIAYRAAVGTREPILDAMDYEEYNLLDAPPMNDHTIFIFTLNPPNAADIGTPQISDDLSAFVASPAVVQNHVPDVSVSVGAQDYSIRSPVPDVINDWNNGFFSNDEANYLNAMKLSPKILTGAFPNGWKKPLSDHLSMITRSNCFKDSRLLLHADCQQAQAFVSRVLEYFMTHTNDILSLKRKQGDSYSKDMEAKFDALASKLAFENGIAGKDIFDPVAFIETFFPRKKADGTLGTPGIDYLASVNYIKVDTTSDKFSVFYVEADKPGPTELEAIGRQLEVPDTITETQEGENTYTWTLTQPHSQHEVTSIARRFIRSLGTNSVYDEGQQSTNFTIIYAGKLSEIDKSMISKKIGGEFTETPQTLRNMYTWVIPQEKTQKELQDIFDSIKNSNEYNFALVPNPTAGADDVTEVSPNNDLANNRLIKVFTMALSSDPKKVIFADLSVDCPAGKTMDEAVAILEKKHVEIAKKMNGRPPQPLVFGGRYIFYEDE